VPYFHVVFTIPHELNKLSILQPSLVYAALFKAASDWLKERGMEEMIGPFNFSQLTF